MRKTGRFDVGAKELGLPRLEAVAHASTLIPIPAPDNSTHRRKDQLAA
jgi:hypothetical protein